MAKLPMKLRSRLTLWYMGILSLLLVIYATIVFAFQSAVLTRQIFHDEVQDVVTVEGLLYFDPSGKLELHQDYFSHPNSHLLIDRLMEVRSLDGETLYRTSTLQGRSLGGPNLKHEGENSFNQRTVSLADGGRVMIISHLHTMQGRTVLIRLGYSVEPLERYMLRFVGLLLSAIVVALGIASLAGGWIAGRALQPIEMMAARAQTITASSLHERLQLPNPNDELGHLGGVINLLLQRLEEAFAQLQRFTADAAHELRTPLAAIRTIGEVTLQGPDDMEVYRVGVANILDEIARLNSTIDSLLLLARAEASHPSASTETFLAGPLLREVLDLLLVVSEDKGIILEADFGEIEAARLSGDRPLLRIAFVNVLHNALKFSPPDTVVRVVGTHVAGMVPRVKIVVQDDGPGIAAAERERVFDRFFTSASPAASAGSGAGLGLSITRLIVERSGGHISFDESSSGGTRCIIDLPATAEPQ